MNSLRSKATIRWGIGVIIAGSLLCLANVFEAEASAITENGFELKNLKDEQDLNRVPGDHDGVGGFERYDRFQSNDGEAKRSIGDDNPFAGLDATSGNFLRTFVGRIIFFDLTLLRN